MNKLVARYPVLGSSSNPEKLGWTASGAIVGVGAILVLLLNKLGVEVTENEVVEVLNAGMVAYSSIMVVVGLLRKAYYKYYRK